MVTLRDLRQPRRALRRAPEQLAHPLLQATLRDLARLQRIPRNERDALALAIGDDVLPLAGGARVHGCRRGDDGICASRAVVCGDLLYPRPGFFVFRRGEDFFVGCFPPKPATTSST